MDRQAFLKRHSDLKHLYQRVQNCESWFLSPDDLQGLGIHAFQVGITENGILQFHPCFFRPHPERILQKYALNPSQYMPELNYRPNLDSIFKRIVEEHPDLENPFKVAMRRYESDVDVSCRLDEWSIRAREIQDHIERQMKARRRGRPIGGSLYEFGTLDLQRTKVKRGDPPTYEIGLAGPHWEIKCFLEDNDEISPMPHAILSTVAHVPANYADQNLTLHEIRAIVNVMLIRTSHRPFSSHPVHPVLILSYTGQKHGRIIQASLDGDNFVIQYSQLWSFLDDDTAPVELFVRYNISQLVGMGSPFPGGRSLGDSMASMHLNERSGTETRFG
ncbi:uncharacterized protein N7459_001129 [Penicillium hispanicum]|uniref:uncharacterized protein n=1 Tax=Penicillium hispanicum TaxID=1080232 RepID=UPI0025400FA0|nr:uncharacterized protein N7459_001129 [Penicillium hispanicum]KAJ5594921.1 hypothetical protein N7459_001129 [Penicillium hispanicum]